MSRNDEQYDQKEAQRTSELLSADILPLGESPYTTRWRRLSSITRAPCRRVMGLPGQGVAVLLLPAIIEPQPHCIISGGASSRAPRAMIRQA
jgi:hypothetical protein